MVSEPAPKVAAMAGKADPREIVLLTPPRKTDESKTISSFALVALASIIAVLNEPVPESLVVVTVKIAISVKQASYIILPIQHPAATNSKPDFREPAWASRLQP
jgi:hypothetical protein